MALLLAWTLALAGCAGERGPSCGDGLALQGVTVVDGLGNPPVPDRTVTVCDGRIVAVEATATAQAPRGAKVANLRGRTVMPGLIDTHAHVTILSPGPFTGDAAISVDLTASHQTLKALVAFGITTVRNPAAPADEGVALRRAVAGGEILGPRIKTTGEALNAGGGGFGPFVAVADPEAVEAEIARQAELGVDFVKLYAGLSPELVGAAVDAAHQRGLPVIGHLQRTSWTEAARLGVDQLTHAAPWSVSYLPDAAREGYRGTIRQRLDWLEAVDLDGPQIGEMITALVDAGVSIDPTLLAQRTKFFGDDPRHTEHPELDLAPAVVREQWGRGTFTDDWEPEDFARGREVWPRLLDLTRRLHEAGVPLTAGSDLPNPWVIPGVSLHEELQLLAEAGIPPLEVLRIATHNGAKALGLGNETGSVEVGKRADLLVLAADPTRRIANTRAIEFVMLGGRVLSPSALLTDD